MDVFTLDNNKQKSISMLYNLIVDTGQRALKA